MSRFYDPILALNPIAHSRGTPRTSLFGRSYWLDMNDPSLVIIMTNRIGAELINGEKRAEKRDHLFDRVCIQEILQPEKE